MTFADGCGPAARWQTRKKSWSPAGATGQETTYGAVSKQRMRARTVPVAVARTVVSSRFGVLSLFGITLRTT
jgi:hypothetical protein